MKEINGQLYGYSYELDQTTEDDLTTCYAIDTGTIFVAFNGVWCEQRDAKWAAGASGSGGGGGGGGGGGSGVLVVGATFDEGTGAATLDKTWQEIYDASRRSVVILPSPEEEGPNSVVSLLTECGVGSVSSTFAIPWSVTFTTFLQNILSSTTFSVDSPDGYPSVTEG